jgi:hypothetical protein
MHTSSYFDVYMNGLQPERYYKILIQVQAEVVVQQFMMIITILK